MNTQIHVPKLSPTNKIILIVLGAFFILCTFFQHAFYLLTLHKATFLWGGYFFEILTYPLYQRALFPALFQGLIIWFIGSDLERDWGKRTYLFFLLASILGGGFLFLLLSMLGSSSTIPLNGAASFTYALLVMYSLLYKDRILYFFVFPMKAQYFCLLLLGIELFSGLRGGLSSWAHLGGALGGFLYITKIAGKSTPLDNVLPFLRPKKKKKHPFKLVKNEDASKADSEDPKYWQ